MDKMNQALTIIRNMIAEAQDDRILNLEKGMDKQLYNQTDVNLGEVYKKNKELEIKLDTLKNVEGILSYISKQEVMRSPNIESEYLKSPYRDIHGRDIIEGHIIKVTSKADNTYGDDPETIYCVEYYNGCFGSCVYSDFEPLEAYTKVEIIGHIEDYRDDIKSGLFSGNALSVLKN